MFENLVTSFPVHCGGPRGSSALSTVACGQCPPVAQKSSLPQGQEGHAELDPHVLAAPEDTVRGWVRVSLHTRLPT